MSEVRFNPKSMPRTTSIARTVQANAKPTNAGSQVTSSPAAGANARAHAAANQPNKQNGTNSANGANATMPKNGAPPAALPSPVQARGIDFTNDELHFLGELVFRARQAIAEAAKDKPYEGNEQMHAELLVDDTTAASVLAKLSTEARSRPQASVPDANANGTTSVPMSVSTPTPTTSPMPPSPKSAGI
jgi:hypothetical protein